jgi:hypothetical protein
LRGYGWTLAPEPVREPTSPPTDRPPRGTIRRPGCTPRGCLTFLVLAVVLGALGKACDWGADAVLTPWAHGIRGPTLTGRWEGLLVAPSGARATILLELRRATYDSGRYTSGADDPEITGSGRWCAGGRSVTYFLQGGYRSGEVSLQLGAERGAAGLVMSSARGRWDGDRLALALSLLRAGPWGTRYDSADPDMRHPVPIVLHRVSTEGDLACASVR